MLDRINAVRLGHGLPALGENLMLVQAARGQAADLARNQWLIDSGRWHEGSDGSSIGDRVARAGYQARQWREIVGWGWGGDAGRMMDWWMASPVHRDVILSAEVTECGAAVVNAPGSAWGAYWCVDFGRPVGDVARPYSVNVPVVVGAGVNPSNSTGIDLLRFKVADPDCWRVVQMTRPDGTQHSEDVQDMDLGGGLFVRRKGSNGEWHRYDDQFFYLVHDTSPDVGTEGVARVYTLYKDGKPGAPKSKRYQAVGEAWVENGLHRVRFRARHGCRDLMENSGEAQNRSTITRRVYNYTFNRYGQGLTFDEVLFEQTGVEAQIYGRKDGRSCGWIGWEAPWGSSEPVAIYWDRGRLTQEPERYCGF